MTTRFDLIAFDADDTLWHSEDSFERSAKRIRELVDPYVPAGIDFDDAVRATERRNLTISGYGIKAWMLSVIETAVAVSDQSVPARVIGELVDTAHEMLMEPVRLLDGVGNVLEQVGATHRLAVITKGDLVHQHRKITTSGLEHHFHGIHVVPEKDVDTYRRIVNELGVEPHRFLMVGNSVRSDVLPVLDLGGHAVHIPYHVTWELEHADHNGDVDELSSIADFPAWLSDSVAPDLPGGGVGDLGEFGVGAGAHDDHRACWIADGSAGEGGDANRACAFQDDAVLGQGVVHGVGDLLLGHQYEVVDQLLDDRERGVVVQSDAALKAVGEGLGLGQLNGMAGLEAGVHHRAAFHRHADHAGIRAVSLDGDSDTTDQPAGRDGDDHRTNV